MSNNTGVLLLPSLEKHGTFIIIYPVSETEAMRFVADYDHMVLSTRKVADFSDISENVSHDLLEFLEFDASNNRSHFDIDPVVADELKVSKISGARGLRPVYINMNESRIGYGTTVIYNENRAMKGVLDQTIAIKLVEHLDRYGRRI